MKIVVDDKIPFIRGAFEPFAQVEYLPGAKISREDLTDAQALVTRTRTKCNETLLKGTAVKFIATATIGYDHIDVEYCRKAGIEWTNAPGCNSGSVMQYMASALVALSARKGFRLEDKIIGIVGVGAVGSKVARLAEIFGMKTLLNDPPRQRAEKSSAFASLEETLKAADILTLHVPLIREGQDKTYHMIDRQALALMKEGSFLINTSRGEAVETGALLQSLRSGKLAGAVLDVWENEPHINLELLELTDIATPHIAGYSVDGKANGTTMSVRAVGDYFGWDLKEWRPADLPGPARPVIDFSGLKKDRDDWVAKAVLHTYDIMNDDQRLRERVEDFEKLRGDYSPRREFAAYSVNLPQGYDSLREKLAALGFKIK